MTDVVLLYVDDDDAAHLLVEIALREAQSKVDLRHAADGEQALAYLRGSDPQGNAPRPDLILLDLNLPKKSGIELLGELKADEALRSIPVIVFSSSARPVDKAESLAHGAREYVTKPPSFASFVQVIRRMVSKEL